MKENREQSAEYREKKTEKTETNEKIRRAKEISLIDTTLPSPCLRTVAPAGFKFLFSTFFFRFFCFPFSLFSVLCTLFSVLWLPFSSHHV